MNLPDYYTAKYCEENVWRLAQDPVLVDGKDAHAVFISNAKKCVPMWKQRAAENPDDGIPWDYHVILIARRPAWHVYDLDTTLPFPTELAAYLRASFPLQHQMPGEFRPLFRVIPVEKFHATFASDRSHMRNEDGSWQAPAPRFPCISTERDRMNLWSFVDMTSPFVGELLDLDGLLAWSR